MTHVYGGQRYRNVPCDTRRQLRSELLRFAVGWGSLQRQCASHEISCCHDPSERLDWDDVSAYSTACSGVLNARNYTRNSEAECAGLKPMIFRSWIKQAKRWIILISPYGESQSKCTNGKHILKWQYSRMHFNTIGIPKRFIYEKIILKRQWLILPGRVRHKISPLFWNGRLPIYEKKEHCCGQSTLTSDRTKTP